MRILIHSLLIPAFFIPLPVFADEVKSVVVEGKAVETSLAEVRITLRQIIAEAEKNIKKADTEIEKQEVLKRNQAREQELVRFFQQGNAFYNQGKFAEAKAAWKRALEISRDPEMKEYIRRTLTTLAYEKVELSAPPSQREDLSRQEADIRKRQAQVERESAAIDEKLKKLRAASAERDSGGAERQKQMERLLQSAEKKK